MSTNADIISNTSASNQLGPRSTPTPSERSHLAYDHCLCPREADWEVKKLTGPIIINGIFKFQAMWNDDAISALSIKGHDLSELATDDLGSFGITHIGDIVRREGHSAVEVRFCDSLVEVKHLGEYWLSYARNLVIKKWGKQQVGDLEPTTPLQATV